MARKKTAPQDAAVEGGPQGLRRRGKNSYYFKRQYRGDRHTIALGCSLDQARLKAQQIINAMDRGDFKLTDYQKPRTGIVEALTDAFDRLGRRNTHKTSTRAAYANRIRQFVAFLAKEYPEAKFLVDLKTDMGQEYVDWRRAQLVSRSGKAREGTPRNNPSARTVSKDVTLLNTLFRLVAEQQNLVENPFAGISVKVKASDKQAAPRSLTQDQVRKLLHAAEAYDQAPRGPGNQSTFRGMMRDILAFYLLTGLRKDELIHLPWSHVDLEVGGYGMIDIGPVQESFTLRIELGPKQANRMAKLASERPGNGPLFESRRVMMTYLPANYAEQNETALLEIRPSAWLAKDRRLLVPTVLQWEQKATQGSIPLTAKSQAILKRMKARNTAGSPFVFPHPDNGPLRSDPLAQMKKILVNAGLSDKTRLHDLRHTFGFTLRDKGVRLETIMGLMRHANIKETMVYAKYTLAEGARYIQQLDDSLA
ncbi:MAG: tyrosine-type recombinase/integrase [Phycisphaeraceae bacterium]